MQSHPLRFHGPLVSGKGEGRYFVNLPWAMSQFTEKLGFSPHPGTLNIKITDAEGRVNLEVLRKGFDSGVRIEPPGDRGCAGICFLAVLQGTLQAAIVLPTVEGYYSDVLEVLSPDYLRGKLSLQDGQLLRIDVMVPVPLAASRVRNIILDLDGTILDSFEPFFKVFNEALIYYGIEKIDTSRLKTLLDLGSNLEQMVLDALPNERKNDGLLLRQIHDQIRSMYGERESRRVGLIGGASEALAYLADAGYKIYAATGSNAPRAVVLSDLERLDVSRHFGGLVCGSEVQRRKPHPDLILECLARFGLPACESLTVGDSVVDVLAGKGAGTMTAAVITGVGLEADLRSSEPDFLTSNLMDLALELRKTSTAPT